MTCKSAVVQVTLEVSLQDDEIIVIACVGNQYKRSCHLLVIVISSTQIQYSGTYLILVINLTWSIGDHQYNHQSLGI